MLTYTLKKGSDAAVNIKTTYQAERHAFVEKRREFRLEVSPRHHARPAQPPLPKQGDNIVVLDESRQQTATC